MLLKTSDYDAIIDPPFGLVRIGIRTSRNAVSHIDYLPRNSPAFKPEADLASEVVKQLMAYFEDPAYRFTLPLITHGTEFQRRVWHVLSEIPSASVLSYGELAKHIKTSPRAIGGACRSNPISIIIPCHRVVAVTGIGGYGGKTQGHKLAIKRWLLDHEFRGVESYG